MTNLTSRIPLAIAAVLSAAGAAIHTAAFGKALPIIAASGMPSFYCNSFKALWLADSAMMVILSITCLILLVWVRLASRFLLVLLALFPLATAALLYTFLGNFPAGHILLAIGALLIISTSGLTPAATGM
jgi:hypothetical protein